MLNPGLLALWTVVGQLALNATRRRSLTTWILVAMVLGAAVGLDWPKAGVAAHVLSLIFLRLIKMIVAPLLFSTLVVGIAGHSSLRQVGRMGLKALVYFEVVSTLALLIGVAAINLTRAGVGVEPPTNAGTTEIKVERPEGADLILNAFPENIAKAIAEGQLLQVVVFSVLFGTALGLLPDAKRAPLVSLAESVAATMFKLTGLIMYAAPVAVGAAIAYAVGHMGLNVLSSLAKLVVTLYLALAAFLLLVLLPIARLAGVPLRPFLRATAEPASIAFATTSSEAALPMAMERMEALGIPREIVAFVMPTGYSFNLDGSSLYQALAAIFVAQAARIELSLSQQLLIVFTLMLSSKGTAGVPRASLVILLGTATSFGLPEWPILMILGVDGLMDMARTSVNVVGNCLATVVVARWEGVRLDAPEQARLHKV